MSTIKFIRKSVFGVRQDEFAKIAGVHQGTVSKWENESLSPDYNSLKLIRLEAKGRGLEWDDSLFFELPDGSLQERNDCSA